MIMLDYALVQGMVEVPIQSMGSYIKYFYSHLLFAGQYLAKLCLFSGESS